MLISEHSRSWVGPTVGIVLLLTVTIAWMKFLPGQGTSAQYDTSTRLPEWSPDDATAQLARMKADHHPERPSNQPLPIDFDQPQLERPLAIQDSSTVLPQSERTETAISTGTSLALPGGRFTDVVPVYFEVSTEASSTTETGTHQGNQGVVSAYWTTIADGDRPLILPVSHQRTPQQSRQQVQHSTQKSHTTSPAWLLGTIETLGRDR